jgi:PhzF family phenazine biosynthesis protein
MADDGTNRRIGMAVRFFQIDAFADRPFTGNPAAVCLLNHEIEAGWMQSVAAEMNLSETAFVRPRDDGFELRWFTPDVEVELCGHATLASAHALWSEQMVDSAQPIRFHTQSGLLSCRRDGELIELDFPATPPQQSDPPEGLAEVLGVTAEFAGRSRFDQLLVVDTESVVRDLRPDFSALRRFPMRGLIVTSRADDSEFDFVSRFFAPRVGVDEDPVTGSAHCCLGPYWGQRLGKTQMTAFQASPRGGSIRVRLRGDRVLLAGQAVTMVRGELIAPAGC